VIVPSVDIRGGSAVQLIGGAEQAIDAGDPRPIAERFGRVGEVAVIDLDAALGIGNNSDLIREIVRRVPCRVGGGIRDAKSAIEWLDTGARKVILGTAARPEVLRDLPRDRVIAALDAREGEVVTEGWTKRTGRRVEDRIEELREYVGGFLVTFVEIEGRMTGLPADRIETLAKLASPAKLTIAGGVRAPDDIAIADRFGADAQVGMALYSGAFDLAQGFTACLTSDRPDGLWPTVVCDEGGRSLGLVYSNLASLRKAIELSRGVYYSRSRGGIWIKGEHSGQTQELVRIETDCDRDCLRFVVRQAGSGFCHTGEATCFGALAGLAQTDRTIAARLDGSTPGSYTARLVQEEGLLRSKLLEEADELARAATPEEAAHEAADLVYFALVAARSRGASLESIERELEKRSLRVTRRAGDAKPGTSGMGAIR